MKLKTMLIIQTVVACLAIISFGISIWQAFWGAWWVGLIAFLLSVFLWKGVVRGLYRKISLIKYGEELFGPRPSTKDKGKGA